MIAPVFYEPNFVDEADLAFQTLSKELDWEQRDAPRQEYYCNDTPDPYVYGVGKGQRQYEPKVWHPTIMTIRKAVESMLGVTLDVCFLNRYLNQKDHLGWHADDSPEMDDARPIAIVSLGVEREIWFRAYVRNHHCAVCRMVDGHKMDCSSKKRATMIGPTEILKLDHGSVAVMEAGMQDLWQHRIPKASFECGERISLTFRGYVKQAKI